MPYPCPIPECDGGPFDRKIDQTSHLRMKDDQEHNQMYSRLNDLGTPMEEVDSETSETNGFEDSDKPELSETIEEKYSGGKSDETDESTDKVIEFDEVDGSNESEGPEGFRKLKNSDPEKLKENFSYIEKGDKPIMKKEVRR